MYELKTNWKVFTSKFVGTGPLSYKKRIYRAAVSQRLRNTALDQQNAQNSSWDTYSMKSYWIFLHVSIHKYPSLGDQTKTVPHKTKLATFIHSWYGVKESDS